jgi:hypothetical protein
MRTKVVYCGVVAALAWSFCGIGCGSNSSWNPSNGQPGDDGGTPEGSSSQDSTAPPPVDGGSNPGDTGTGMGGDVGVPPVESGPGGPSVSTVFSIDPAGVVGESNIVLTKPNTNPQDFMPLGNGTLGVAVWAAGGFTAQLNRTDTLPNRQSPGQVTIPGLATLTGASDFKGTVDLYNAKLVESGGGMTATTYVRADAPEMIVDVTGADPTSMQSAQIQLWSPRAPMAQASGNIAVLSETWQDTGMGASNQTFGSLAAVTVGGQNVSASMVDNLTVKVTFQPNSDGSFRVVVASPTWTGGDAMSTATMTLGSDATAASTTLQSGHLSFWHDYWSRVGLLQATSSDGSASYFEALRTIYLYLTAGESRGVFPGSQAGLADIYDFLKDTQPWYPAGYWGWNTRMMVYANMTSGAFDMNTPVFHLYQTNVAAMQSWTMSQMNGKSGICLPETMRFNGNGYWYNGEGNSSCATQASPSYNALTITSGAEVSLWIWDQYQMTQDMTFLSTNYPVMSQAATFLLAWATTGQDNLLHTNANAHETQWAVNDPTTDIVAMQALFPAVISAAGLLNTDSALVAQLKDALTKLPDLPRTDAASHMQLLTAADDAAGQDVYAISYQPSAPRKNSENLELEAVWPYGLIGDNSPNLPLATRSYKSRLYVHAPDWSVDAIQAARLGLGDEVVSALTAVTQSYQTFVNGMAILFGGANTGTSEPYIEQAGVVAAAMNEAFVQDYDGLLRIVPAWPQGWDGAGTIYVQGQSKVDVQVKGGTVTLVVVEAGSTGMMQVRNPWSGQAATVVDGTTGATAVASTSSATFALPVVAGHWYAIVPASQSGSLPSVMVTGTPATSTKTLGPVSIGL